jgi:hypothetical protein
VLAYEAVAEASSAAVRLRASQTRAADNSSSRPEVSQRLSEDQVTKTDATVSAALETKGLTMPAQKQPKVDPSTRPPPPGFPSKPPGMPVMTPPATPPTPSLTPFVASETHPTADVATKGDSQSKTETKGEDDSPAVTPQKLNSFKNVFLLKNGNLQFRFF